MKETGKKESAAPKGASGGQAMDPAFARVVEAYASDRAVTVGWKFGTTSLRRDGKVFVMLMPAKFVARLPRARVDELVAAGVGTNLVMGKRTKRTMKDWLAVEGERRRWLSLAREAYRALGD